MNTFKSLVSHCLFGVALAFLLIMSRTTPVLAAEFPAQFELSSLDGVNGFTLNGIASAGARVTGAGDVNGDGFPDFYVTDSFTSPNGASSGQAFVVFGGDQDFPAILELSSLDGANGFVLNGVAAGDRLRTVSETPGDVNGDGINDLIVAAPQADPHGSASGQTYVVFGTDQGFPPVLELSSLDGVNGFTVNGIEEFDGSGTGASIAGDVNNDGIDDIIIGARAANFIGTFQGAAYVIFGTDQGFPAVLELSSLNGVNGFTLTNLFQLAGLVGSSVSGAGDVNDDGIDDFIIGALSAGSSGESYVVFGTDQGFPILFDLSLLDGTDGFAIRGSGALGDSLGGAVNAAGDVNGDGIADVIVAAAFADPNGITSAGQVYVVFGSDQGFAAAIDVLSLDGTNGFILNGIADRDRAGTDASQAGDINGDGIGDVIVGAILADPNGQSSGQSYVVYGSAQGFPAVIEASSLDGLNGFALNGIDENDLSGHVSGIGDVNGDGRDDILISASGADPDGIQRGQVYVVYGVGDPPAPSDLINDLIESVISLDLNPGTENPLLDKLFAASNVLENGNVTATVVKLEEFIILVNMKRGRTIPDAAADQLISDAQEIIDLLEPA